ncbi:MAG: GAF domain-containing protein, partial [Candidatus Glassbacteria bacterium]|nr:GAF domain-containing protein [Candidatus Glassbacteria bacterium]
RTRPILLCRNRPKEEFLLELINGGLAAACFISPYPAARIEDKISELTCETPPEGGSPADCGENQTGRRCLTSLENNIASLLEEVHSQAIVIEQMNDLLGRIQKLEDFERICRDLALKAMHSTESSHSMILLPEHELLFLADRKRNVARFKIGAEVCDNKRLPFKRMLLSGEKLHLAKYAYSQLDRTLEGFPSVRQFLGVPFMLNNVPMALICVMNPEKAAYDRHDRFFLENIASVGGTALGSYRTLRKLADTDRQLDEAYSDLNTTYFDLQSHVVVVDQVQEIARKIHAHTDIDFIIRELIGNVIHLLACDYGLIYFREKDPAKYHLYANDRKLLERLEADRDILSHLPDFNTCLSQKKTLMENAPSPEIKKGLQRLGVNLSNLVCMPLVKGKSPIGILAAFNKSKGENFSSTDKYLLQALGSSAITVIMNSELIQDLKNLFEKSVAVLANAIEARDTYTRGHTDRVTGYVVHITRELGWSEKRIEQARIGTLLHDVGKIGIPDAVLNKPTRLSEEEFVMMRNHVSMGVKIVKDIMQLKKVMNFIHHHHERCDGRGYPHGL